MTEPLFKSAHDALVFAFNYSGQQYGKTQMSKIVTAGTGTGKGLSGLDGAAQAGMIRAEVRRLGEIGEAILTARYAPGSIPCPGCTCPVCPGEHPNLEWTAAIKTLEEYLKKDLLASCRTTWDMRMQYVMRLFLPPKMNVPFSELAARNLIGGKPVSKRTIREHFSLVKRHFQGENGLEPSYMRFIEDMLSERGVI